MRQVKKALMTRALTAEELSKYSKSKKRKYSVVKSRSKRAATARKDRLWDYGIIPYDIEANFTGEVVGIPHVNVYSTGGILDYSTSRRFFLFLLRMRCVWIFYIIGEANFAGEVLGNSLINTVCTHLSVS